MLLLQKRTWRPWESRPFACSSTAAEGSTGLSLRPAWFCSAAPPDGPSRRGQITVFRTLPSRCYTICVVLGLLSMSRNVNAPQRRSQNWQSREKWGDALSHKVLQSLCVWWWWWGSRQFYCGTTNADTSGDLVVKDVSHSGTACLLLHGSTSWERCSWYTICNGTAERVEAFWLEGMELSKTLVPEVASHFLHLSGVKWAAATA